MSFKKLALVSAMFAATSGAFAMEALDEEALAATTGQDGITITLATQANLDVIIHDKDGLTGVTGFGTSHTNSGAIVLEGVAISNGAGGDASIAIKIDAGASAAAASDATLNINITTGTLALSLGSLGVANSSREAGTGWGYDAGTLASGLLNLGTLSMNGAVVNVQLGNEPSGDLIAINSTLTGGLTLSNVALNDVAGTVSGGSIRVGALSVTNAGGTALTVDLGINASATGLVVRVDQLGAGTGATAADGMAVTLADVRLGSAAMATIGDIEIRGLNLNGDTITVSGH